MGEAESNSGSGDDISRFTIDLRWDESHRLAQTFSNAVLSQFTPAGEFIVTFGQVELPNTLQHSPAEIVERGHIDITPVARVVMTAERMHQAIGVLQSNYDRYMAALEQLPASDADA